MPTHLVHTLDGKKSICWGCDREFVLDIDALQEDYPKCEDCRNAPFTNAELDEMLILQIKARKEGNPIGPDEALQIVRERNKPKTFTRTTPTPDFTTYIKSQSEPEPEPKKEAISSKLKPKSENEDKPESIGDGNTYEGDE